MKSLSYSNNAAPAPFTTITHNHKMIRVCAWCPKEKYPQLKAGEEYTHGMCRRHYRQITRRKNLALSLLANELIQHAVTTLDETSETFRQYSLKYMRIILSAVRF